MKTILFPGTALLLLMLTGCASSPEEELAGRIWSDTRRDFITERELTESLQAEDFLLLGEIHDHPEHHRIRAELIRSISGEKRQPVMTMEMIDRDHRESLREYLAREDADAEGLGPALDWEATGWPDWALYKPLAEAALARGLAIADGNLPRARVREMVRGGGLQALPEEKKKALHLDTPLPEEADHRLLARLRESHCDMLPEEALRAMRDGQRLRDAWMASRMRELNESDGVILIAGNAHVQHDHGVPWYLRASGEKSVFSLALIPVRPGLHRVEDYLPEGMTSFPWDAVYFTSPRPEPPPDPCEIMKEAGAGAEDQP